jgi:ABC-2 type transport system ATP-binding protein
MLKIKDLKKSYKDVNALKGVSFSINQGEIFGLLGPNGAGKTTAISIISSLLRPDTGTMLYDDKDILKNRKWWRERIGIVPQEMAFYEELTGRDNLLLWASMYGLKRPVARQRCEELFDIMGLTAKIKTRVSEYSGGMKRRLNIALGVIHKPEMLFLDEPTVGIDVQAKLKIKEILEGFSRQGMSMIYTTHQLEEAQKICHKIAIIDEGEIKALGTLDQLIAGLGEEDTLELNGKFSDEAIIDSIIGKISGTRLISFSEKKIILGCNTEEKIPDLIKLFFKNQIFVKKIDIKRPDLETLFISLTGKGLRE